MLVLIFQHGAGVAGQLLQASAIMLIRFSFEGTVQ